MTRRGLEYRVIAVDIVDNQGQGPTELKLCEPCRGDNTEDELFFPVRTRIEGDGDFRTDADGQPVPLFSGEEEANYQLITTDIKD